MFENFTDRSRKVLSLANQEAQRLNHEYIGTEHLLLGLVKEGSGVGATVLKNLDVDLRKIRTEVEKLVRFGPEGVPMGKYPQTPRATKVIEYAIEEARNIGHKYVGTEHLLLGLIRENDGVAAQVLKNLGLTPGGLRADVFNLLGAGESATTPAIVQEMSIAAFVRELNTQMEQMGKRCRWWLMTQQYGESEPIFLVGGISLTVAGGEAISLVRPA